MGRGWTILGAGALKCCQDFSFTRVFLFSKLLISFIALRMFRTFPLRRMDLGTNGQLIFNFMAQTAPRDKG